MPSRTIIDTADLDPEVFGEKDGFVTVDPAKLGLAGPFQLSGDIADYTNQSEQNELVWYGGTEKDPDCAWVVFADGRYSKVKSASTGTGTFCENVLACIQADLAKANGEDDKYIIEEMDGPTWQVLSVSHGEPLVEADFSADTGSDLATLVDALNGSANLPEGWSWSIYTSALTLSVPHETTIGIVELPGGESITFPDGPDVEGSDSSSLSDTFSESGLGLASSADTGEDDIEATYAAYEFATVRWQDDDGDERISYKDPEYGWWHPATKMLINDDPELVISRDTVSGGGVDSDNHTIADIKVPSDATHVLLELVCGTIPPATSGETSAIASLYRYNDFSGPTYGFTTSVAPSTQSSASIENTLIWLPVDEKRFRYSVSSFIGTGAPTSTSVEFYIRGWKR